MAAQQVDPGALEFIQRPGLRGREQFQGLAERAGLQAGLRRGQDAFGVSRRVGGQCHRSFEERRGRGHSAAGLRPAGRAFELGGDVLVRPGRGLGPVPGPAIRIGLRVSRLGQRRVQLLPVGQRRRPVGRRARQRMPEPHPAAELDQPRLHRRRPGLDRDAQPPSRPPHQRPVTGRIGRRQLQQPPGLVGQGVQLTGKAILNPARQRRGTRQPEAARQLRRAQSAWQLQQRQRVPPGLGDDQVGDPRVQRPGQRRGQQRPRIAVTQPCNFELWQPGQFRARLADREHQADRVGAQPPRREPQRLRRGPVQPLRVIDQADQRPVLGHLRQQAQHSQAHQEPVRRRPRGEAERGPQRIMLRQR